MKSNIAGKISQVINAPASEVWEALTKPELIKKYFFQTTAISNWKEGSSLIFKGEYGGTPYQDKGTILKMVPDKLFKYEYWSSLSGIEDKPENYVIITYELKSQDDKTELTVTQENIPDEKMKKHSEENWKKILDNLKNLLEKEKV